MIDQGALKQGIAICILGKYRTVTLCDCKIVSTAHVYITLNKL